MTLKRKLNLSFCFLTLVLIGSFALISFQLNRASVGSQTFQEFNPDALEKVKSIDTEIKNQFGSYKISFQNFEKAYEPNTLGNLPAALISSRLSFEDFVSKNGLKASYKELGRQMEVSELKSLITNNKSSLVEVQTKLKEVIDRLKSSEYSKKEELIKLLKIYAEEQTKFSASLGAATAKKPDLEELSNFLTNKMKEVKEVNWSIPVEKTFGFGDKLKKFNIFLIGTCTLTVIVSFFIAIFLSRSINKVGKGITELKSYSSRFNGVVSDIKSSSDELSNITEIQSSAVHQTASSINQITAMVTQNAKSAMNSEKITEENTVAALQGRKTVENVISSMNSLLDSSKTMNHSFEKTSQELEDIVLVINQIGEKAKVIHDIVFQTKLLSFNASVEAARAGEHGKGFSVVAEEIGNLASMSGQSAEEIGEILSESVEKVTSLVERNKSEMNKMIGENNNRVNRGIQTAKECETSLKKILNNAELLKNSMSEISTASKEQDSGIQEISQAINNLSQTTTDVTRLINQSNEKASEIENNSQSIFEAALGIESVVDGNESKAA